MGVGIEQEQIPVNQKITVMVDEDRRFRVDGADGG